MALSCHLSHCLSSSNIALLLVFFCFLFSPPSSRHYSSVAIIKDSVETMPWWLDWAPFSPPADWWRRKQHRPSSTRDGYRAKPIQIQKPRQQRYLFRRAPRSRTGHEKNGHFCRSNGHKDVVALDHHLADTTTKANENNLTMTQPNLIGNEGTERADP